MKDERRDSPLAMLAQRDKEQARLSSNVRQLIPRQSPLRVERPFVHGRDWDAADERYTVEFDHGATPVIPINSNNAINDPNAIRQALSDVRLGLIVFIDEVNHALLIDRTRKELTREERYHLNKVTSFVTALAARFDKIANVNAEKSSTITPEENKKEF
jgi:hypothetical protein